MDINIGSNIYGGLADLFRNYTFKLKVGQITDIINPIDGNKNIVQAMVITPQTYEGDDNGMPVFKQKVTVTFEPGVTTATSDAIFDGMRTDSIYGKCDYKIGSLPTSISEEGSSMNTLFQGSHSYYNICFPEYDMGSKNAVETAMPSALLTKYHSIENSSLSKFFFTKGNNIPHPTLAPTNHTEEFDSSPSFNAYTMKHITTPLYYGTNYYYTHYDSDSFAANEFASRNNYFITTLLHDDTPKWRHYPFYNYVVLPTTPNNNSTKIRRALERAEHQDILMRYVHYSTPDFGINGSRGWTLDKLLYDMNYPIERDNLSHYTEDSLSMYPDSVNSLQNDVAERSIKSHLWEDTQIDLVLEVGAFLYEKCLSLREMYYSNKSCDYEMLFHRVIKHRAGRNTPVQSFHIFRPYRNNTNKTNKYFYDTQIRHGTEYSYSFFPCVAQVFMRVTAVAATSGITGNDSQPREVTVTYEIRPELRILELPVGNFATTVVEPPPREPIIKFSNYVNKDNMVKINLSDRFGIRMDERSRKRMMPVETQDEIYLNKLYSYNRSYFAYSSDVAAYGKFEIYRTTVKPTALEDFSGHLIQVVDSMTLDEYSRKKEKKFYTIHNLEHGKTYYYLFRALSHDAAFSEHSPVYQVQKIKDSDETILNVSSFHLTFQERSTYNTTFRKFLKLEIPDYHTTIRSVDSNGNEVDTAFGANVKLELGETGLSDRLWDYNSLDEKYIKLRIESKTTGKKIDLNLVFNYKQPENN